MSVIDRLVRVKVGQQQIVLASSRQRQRHDLQPARMCQGGAVPGVKEGESGSLLAPADIPPLPALDMSQLPPSARIYYRQSSR